MENQNYIQDATQRLKKEIVRRIERKEYRLVVLAKVLDYSSPTSVTNYLNSEYLTLDYRLINLCNFLKISLKEYF